MPPKPTGGSKTRSMRIAPDDLRLQRLDVVYPGPDSFEINHRIRAVALRDVPQLLARRRR